ncbi:MAG: winged helix-turn-helix domain-containing protein [Terriglobales bacterium]|jgi:TolB-like protein/DNA-binding winged helix-turn-helix (wHTH) protein
MEDPAKTKLRIGDWCVDRSSGQVSRDGKTVRLEERSMRLLLCLAEHAGGVVSVEELLNQVWPEVTVTQDSVYQAVTTLRRVLGDDPKQPAYIATVPRLGYRMVARVSPWTDPQVDDPPRAEADPDRAVWYTRGAPFLVGAVVIVVLACLVLGKSARNDPRTPTAVAARPQKSIAVLPFLDLTEGMKEEEFADGMTEELIDRFSKVPGLQVPSATSSFYYKDKQVPIGEIAKALAVEYVVDGSVRKSGDRLRVAARLVRAENGYVVWTETYDRPFDDLLMVQDDIAGEVTKALKSSIEGAPQTELLPSHSRSRAL